MTCFLAPLASDQVIRSPGRLRPPHAQSAAHDRASWERELYESIEWIEGGFDNFELSAIPRMALDVGELKGKE